MVDPVDDLRSSSAVGWLLSTLFWISLGICAALTMVLVLAPRYLEYEGLRRRYLQNASEVAALQREAAHLNRVIQALRTDPDYVARVAVAELRAVPVGNVRIPLDESLEYDSRSFSPLQPETVSPLKLTPHWSLPLLEKTVTSPALRMRLCTATALLLSLSFFCFNDSFLSGGFGMTLRTIAGTFRKRYCSSPSAAGADQLPDNRPD